MVLLFGNISTEGIWSLLRMLYGVFFFLESFDE
jgi:hypothetical protein